MKKEQPMRREGSWACLFQVCRAREAWIISGLQVGGARAGVRRARQDRELLRDVTARLMLVVANQHLYCTSFCNHAHDVNDGKPVNHMCFVLDTKALASEIAGRTPDGPMHKGKVHNGKRA